MSFTLSAADLSEIYVVPYHVVDEARDEIYEGDEFFLGDEYVTIREPFTSYWEVAEGSSKLWSMIDPGEISAPRAAAKKLRALRS